MSLLLSLFLPCAIAASVPPVEILQADLFKLGSDRRDLLFKYQGKRTTLADGTVHLEATFMEPNGTQSYTELSEWKEGRLKFFDWQQFQTGQSGRVEVKGDKAIYSMTEKGKTETSIEEAKPNFVVGPTVPAYVSYHFNDLTRDNPLNVSVGVPDRMENFSFRMSVEKIQGSSVVLKFKPTSFIIAAVVDPLYFEFSKDGKKLMSIKGRSPLKVKQDGKWKNTDMETVFK